MFGPAQQRQLIGAGVVEVEGSGLRLRWGIAVPLEEQMGGPEPGQITRQLQQPEQIIGTGELHPTPLQPHQQIGCVLAAAGQLQPLIAAGPVHIHHPSRRLGHGW